MNAPVSQKTVAPGQDPLKPDAHAPGMSKSPVTPPPAPWIPIRSLSVRHKPRILAHLIALAEEDRYLRFGFPATDAQIERYVDSLDFTFDQVFGIFNRRLVLVALAHLAFPRPGQPRSAGAEFGGSVASHLRGQGYGKRLFEQAMLHARNRGIDTLYIHALSENTAMLRIARRAGAKVERFGSESDAHLRLPPDTLASRMEQLVDASAGEIDYRIKHGARQMDGLVSNLSELTAGLVGLGRKDQDRG